MVLCAQIVVLIFYKWRVHMVLWEPLNSRDCGGMPSHIFLEFVPSEINCNLQSVLFNKFYCMQVVTFDVGIVGSYTTHIWYTVATVFVSPNHQT